MFIELCPLAECHHLGHEVGQSWFPHTVMRPMRPTYGAIVIANNDFPDTIDTQNKSICSSFHFLVPQPLSASAAALFPSFLVARYSVEPDAD